MQFARLIARWFKPDKPDFAAMREGIRRVHAGETDHFDLPPGWSFRVLVPECPICGYRGDPGSHDAEGDAENRGLPRVSRDLPGTEKQIVRNEPHLDRMIAPLTDAEQAEAGSRHGGVLPAHSDESGRARRTDGCHAVPPVHFFIDQIHRRIMGGKPAAAQVEAA
jgi:hypothetical protein